MTMNSFQKLEKIGEGTYGIVYRARNRATGAYVALKKIRLDTENDGIPPTTVREILLLKNLKHSTIIDLIEVIPNEDKLYLVFEYMETDLKQYLEFLKSKGSSFSPQIILKMVHQLCTAVAFCHSKNIFHRDLKPQNILLDANFNVKLADFGLARAAGIPLRNYTTEIITLWYRAPELLLGTRHYDASVDVWSLACIITEICTMTPLFMGDSEIDQLYKIFSILGTPDKHVWENIVDFPNYKYDFPQYNYKGLKSFFTDEKLEEVVNAMLVYNPLKRISAEEALRFDYFKGVTPILE